MQSIKIHGWRIGHKRRSTIVASMIMLTTLSLTAQVQQNALISPSAGRLGSFALGSRLPGKADMARSDCRIPGALTNELCYSSRSRDFFVGVDTRGLIVAVRTTSPDMFTDRYIRPGHTKMSDVVSRYGVPSRIDRSGTSVLFVYASDGLTFEAAGGRTSKDIMPNAVIAITLRTPSRR